MNFDRVIYRSGLMQLNIYNINKIVYPRKYKISANFATLGNVDGNLKLADLLKYFLILGNQRPYLNFIDVKYYRKKIVKNLLFETNLSHRNSTNFLIYIIKFYIHFFNIYFQHNLKYNFLPTCFKLYLDNPHFFFKSYSKKNHRIRFHFSMRKIMDKSDFFYLANYYLLNITSIRN